MRLKSLAAGIGRSILEGRKPIKIEIENIGISLKSGIYADVSIEIFGKREEDEPEEKIKAAARRRRGRR